MACRYTPYVDTFLCAVDTLLFLFSFYTCMHVKLQVDRHREIGIRILCRYYLYIGVVHTDTIYASTCLKTWRWYPR